jgi:hypothetical protein
MLATIAILPPTPTPVALPLIGSIVAMEVWQHHPAPRWTVADARASDATRITAANLDDARACRGIGRLLPAGQVNA